MRCGFCLPHCPTFAITNRERSSPRGRAQLAKAVAQGELELSEAVCYEGFFCLDCRACTTVCPAGVKVGPINTLNEVDEKKKKKKKKKTPPKAFFLVRWPTVKANRPRIRYCSTPWRWTSSKAAGTLRA